MLSDFHPTSDLPRSEGGSAPIERRRHERAPAEREGTSRAFFETLDDIIFVGSPDGQILFSNPAATQKLGYSPEEFRTMRLLDLHPAEFRKEAEEILGAMFRKECDSCPLPLQKKSGEHLPVRTRAWAGQWEQKDCLFGLSKDMTMLKRADDAKEEMLERLLKIASQVPGVIYQYRLRADGTSCFPFASEAIREIYRVSPEEVREDASKVLATIHPEDSGGVAASILKSAEDLSPWQHEYRVKFPDGAIRALYGNAVPQREADGAVLWHGFITDITDRKQAEEAQRQLVDRLALATKAGGVGIWDWDIAADILVWDDQMYRQYGIAADRFSGAYEAWVAGLHPDDRQRGDEEIQMALRGEKDFDTEFRVLWPNGEVHHIRAMALVQRNAAGEPLHMVGTNWDISVQKRMESAVIENAVRAGELSRLKSRFVSMASHELKTPLANVMLASELLKDFGAVMPADRSQAVLDGLVSSVASMVQTLDALLFAGKIEDGKMAFTPARFNLLGFLRRCGMEVRKSGEPASRIEVVFQDAGLDVVADERLLQHILRNLLENALKYSPADSTIEVRADCPGHDLLSISVRDRGIGVPEPDRKFLFDAFSRATNVGDKPGSGLGLFIAQKCAQTHGGLLQYFPQKNGSLFSLTVPLSPLPVNAN